MVVLPPPLSLFSLSFCSTAVASPLLPTLTPHPLLTLGEGRGQCFNCCHGARMPGREGNTSPCVVSRGSTAPHSLWGGSRAAPSPCQPPRHFWC